MFMSIHFRFLADVREFDIVDIPTPEARDSGAQGDLYSEM
jgi:hypothetical protein